MALRSLLDRDDGEHDYEVAIRHLRQIVGKSLRGSLRELLPRWELRQLVSILEKQDAGSEVAQAVSVELQSAHLGLQVGIDPFLILFIAKTILMLIKVLREIRRCKREQGAVL